MDGQNFENGLDNNQGTETTPVVEPVVEPAVEPVSEPVVETVNVNTGSYNYQDNTANAGSYNYQDNTAQYSASVYVENSNQTNGSTPGFAIASLVLGIISILICCCWGSGIVLAIPGLILGISANKKQKTGIGTAGIICSIIGTVLNVIALLYYVVVLIAAMIGA